MMTLDSRLRSAVDDTRKRISGLQPPPIRDRRRWIPAVGWVAAAAALVIVVVVAWPRPDTDQPVVTDVAPGEIILSQDPLVVRGAPSPEPRFATAPLGTEVVLNEPDEIGEILSQLAETSIATEGGVGKVIVAGAIESGDTAGMILADMPRPARTEWCIWIIRPSGDSPGCAGGLDLDDQFPVSHSYHGLFAWGPAPANTSVVTLTYNDTSLWQRPVGGVVLFNFPVIPGQFVMSALDENGDPIHTETHPLDRGLEPDSP